MQKQRVKCKHKNEHCDLGWWRCNDCNEWLYPESSIRAKTFLDRDDVGTHELYD